MLKCRNWRRLLGGRGLKRPRPQLGCNAIEEEKKKDKKNYVMHLCKVLSNKVFLPKANFL